MYSNIFITLKKLYKTVKLFIFYYILGLFGIADDILHKKQNKVHLEDRTGYVAVVTGGSRGIGACVVEMLMKCNMHVIIGCRNVDAGLNTIKKIRDEGGVTKGNATVIELDTGSLKSVQKFANKLLATNSRIDILVNNAGIMFVPYKETEDGFEEHFAVNYLGHFLLTKLLLPTMNKTSVITSSSPRIVNVSSIAHETCSSIDFEYLNNKEHYVYYESYGISKMCQILSTKMFQRQLKASGSLVDVFAVHPGVVNSDLLNTTALKMILPKMVEFLCKSPEEGAASIVYASMEKSLNRKGGLYLSNCRATNCNKYSNDVLAQEKLYQMSVDFVDKYLPR